MRLTHLRKIAASEEIDYLFLKDKFKEYSCPRDKISALLRAKDLIRVKKGLYIFGEDLALEPYCKETLANLIYGPSAISLEYALGLYGMLPERVETITSITNKKDKSFHTPVGDFTYKYINPTKYPVGITRIQFDRKHSVLIAGQEKAVADLLSLTYGLYLNNIQELRKYLFDNLRLNDRQIFALNKKKLRKIAAVYKNIHVDLLVSLLDKK